MNSTTYRLTLQAAPEPDDPEGVRRLRALLKRILRTHGMKCINVEPAPAELAVEPIAKRRAGGPDATPGPGVMPMPPP